MTELGVTKRACVIGWPIEHSRSPLIHECWLKHYGINGCYLRQAVKPGDVADFLLNLEAHGFVGCNVTVPHKEAAYKFADVKHDAAQAVGAANTLWMENGELHATNTDTYGFMAYLDQKVPNWIAKDQRIIVLGAGGAARAIVYGLLSAGCPHITLLNRTKARADEVKMHFGGEISVVDWQDRNAAVKDATLVINTTSLGMNGTAQPDVDLSKVDKACVVSDIVYTPLETGFLKTAKGYGLMTVDGLGMLLHQAVPGFEQWFGVRPTVTDDLYQLVADDVWKSQC